MIEITVSIQLPYSLGLESGALRTSPAGHEIHILELDRTGVSAVFAAEPMEDRSVRRSRRIRIADELLQRTNRLLRWYRAISRSADVTELTRAQVSPFIFGVSMPGNPETWDTEGWIEPLEFVAADLVPSSWSVAELSHHVEEGLSTGREPSVEVLFLLDAVQALHLGRFRECVLFCWCTIDSVFNRGYDALAACVLREEWAAARDAVTALDFGMRNKMTVGMRLLANRSFFLEPDAFWDKLTSSYKKRNTIIHRADNAMEADAELALEVARRMVAIMADLSVLPSETP
jgi:hypothetical protein